MGGFCGVASKRDCVLDVFFAVDYHSHLGTRRAGMIFHDEDGFQRQIHSIENTPFRTRFEDDLAKFHGNCGIGCISDTDPQPLLVRSHLGVFAITTIGCINNADDLVDEYFSKGDRQFMAMSSGKVNSTELVAALINQREDFVAGIKFAQEVVDGSLTLLIMTDDEHIIAARDKMGRLPILIGKNADGYCASFESFAYEKLGYITDYELGPGEIVDISCEGYRTLAEPGDKMKICAFLWIYYGYPNSKYEGENVEVVRNRNGAIMARDEKARGILPDVDSVGGVPDSGVAHGIGYSNESGLPYARPFIKYTPTWPRSFMPQDQSIRNRVAKMKLVPVPELIEGKKLLFVDDSIVRGTQLRETVSFLYDAGAAEVHMRSACPPIMYGCKYLTFSRNKDDMDLLARRVVQQLEGDEGQEHLDEYADATTERGACMLKTICEEMGFDSLSYQSLPGMLEAIGIDPSTVCTYCWDGRE
ncbi:MAG TPA: amidophosphoribosyltransferase [Coriobacteriaceae bacterium]|nr:amidophosphoribosyltransferase [Coriobacteriaceae bacterium]